MNHDYRWKIFEIERTLKTTFNDVMNTNTKDALKTFVLAYKQSQADVICYLSSIYRAEPGR